MSEADDLALVPIILPRAEDLVPTDHLKALERRRTARAAAAESARAHGCAALFCAVVATVAGLLLSTGVGPVVAFLVVCGALGGVLAGIALGWETFERIGFLCGTRDESRYLPQDCRTHARDEANLLESARDLDARILGWNQAVGVMREADEDEPRALQIAAAARRMLVARHERLASAAGAIPRLPAPADGPPALPAASR